MVLYRLSSGIPLKSFLKNAREFLGGTMSETIVEDEAVSLLEALFTLDRFRKAPARKKGKALQYFIPLLPDTVPQDLEGWRIPLIWSLVCRLGNLSGPGDPGRKSRALMDEWMLGKGIADCLTRLGAEEGRAEYELLLIRILTKYPGSRIPTEQEGHLLKVQRDALR